MPTNITNEAEANLITKSEMTRIREIDFARRFTGTILRKLIEALGVTRKIPMMDGTTMYYYTTTGTLEDGNVAEGEVIPLSKYQRNKTAIGEITLKKWRKASSAEAILKSGYDEAVRQTDQKCLLDVQTGIRTDFFNSLKAINGTAIGASTLQMVLAKTWGNLQVLFENDAVEVVHFLHPLTIAEYLGAANITVQTAFGFNYIADFLGLGTIIMTSQIPQGQVISTAKENLIMYYVPITSDAMASFNMTSDETGYIGVNSGYPTNERAQVETLVFSGIQFLVEYASGVVFGQIDATPTLQSITVTSDLTGASSGESHISTSVYGLGTGEKFVYKTGTAAVDVVYGQYIDGWTDLPADGIIKPTASHTKITVAAVDVTGRAQAAGNQTLSIKA